MSKICLITDIHFGYSNNSEVLLNNTLAFFRNELIPNLKKKRIKDIYILGDLFDSDRVGDKDILRTAVLLSRIECPVYIIPGNHDWWHHGGTLHAFSIQCKQYPNIHLRLENEPFSVEDIDGVTFYPSPIMKRNPIQDLSEWIPERKKEDG